MKGFFTFLLSLIVIVYPALCFSQSQDTTAHRGIDSNSNKESQVRFTQDRPFSADIEAGHGLEASVETGVTEHASRDGSQLLAPVLSFTVQSLSISESNGSIDIGVKLVEANNSPVEVTIAYLPGSSSASASDISNFQRQILRFDGTEPAGTIKTVRVLIANDSEYENTETAVFRLLDNTAGSLAEPSQLNLRIRDNDTPDIVINEVFADAAEGFGDANGDGVANPLQDQFVEIINNEGNSVDLSGWRLSDALETRYVFPSGTILPAGRAAVIFGGGNPSGFFGGAKVFTADGLELDNTGDSIELSDERGNPVAEFTFSGSVSDRQSVTRDTDIFGSNKVKHSEASNSGRALFSPGTRIDGSSFGSRFAAGLRGNEGWRLISTPARNTTFQDLFGNFNMQTSPGANNQDEWGTIYEWDIKEGGSFKAVNDLNQEMKPGNGYAIYLFEDDDPGLAGIQGGFPKLITTDKPENSSSVTVTLSLADTDNSNTLSAGEGWNLLGNPFGVKISVDGVLASLRNALKVEDRAYDVNSNIYVWEPAANGGNGDYIALRENNNNTIDPFQAFWVRTTNVGNSSALTVNVALEKNEVAATSNRLYSESNRQDIVFELYLGDGNIYDDYQLVFNSEGEIELDKYDAFKLSPLNSNAISLYSSSGENELMKNVLPSELGTAIEIPLHFEAGDRQSLSFSWKGLVDIPDNWELTLFDRKLNKEINLRSVTDYSFAIPSDEDKSRFSGETKKPQLRKTNNDGEQPRFVLSVNPGTSEQVNSPDIPESVKLNPNYPNPFNPATTISFELKEESEVLLSIWNIVGQRVVTLVDGMREAGEHTATWNASEMPSGIYIAQLEVGGEVFIRKMTLIK